MITYTLCALLSLPAFSAVVLQYHHVSDETPESTSIAPRLFEQHLQLIESMKLSVWSLPRLVSALRNNAHIPDKVVVITFDDAYDSIYKQAYPLLKKRDWPFTVFVATEPVDKGTAHFMSWRHLKEMSSNGATIANHTRSHTHLVRILSGENSRTWLARVESEIKHAQQRIEAEIGQQGRYIAYPYGETLPEIESLILSMNFTGFGQHSGALDSRISLANLPRFPMNNKYGKLDELATKLQSLAMPILSVTPKAAVISPTDLNKGIELSLDAKGSDVSQLNCFFSGRGRLNIKTKLEGEQALIRSEGISKLPPGRNRINCTAPAKGNQTQRYHWASHVWMTQTSEGQWYEEL